MVRLVLVTLLAPLAAFAHPPDCPPGREGDHCRDWAYHEHPSRIDCPKDEGDERDACLIEARKSTGHPAIWRCEGEVARMVFNGHEDGVCRWLMQRAREFAYVLMEGDCQELYWEVTPIVVAGAGAQVAYFAEGVKEAVLREKCGPAQPPVARLREPRSP